MFTMRSLFGTQQYKGRTSSQLADTGVFVYEHFFELGPHLSFGKLGKIEVPEFASSEWPLPSTDISEAYRLKLFQEVQKALKGNLATRIVKIKVCLPITVFIDFFALSDRPIDLKNTMLAVKHVDSNTMLEFLDRGWDTKLHNGIFCRVNSESINVKYMIKTQNFIMSFSYQRSFNVNGNLVVLDHSLTDEQNNPLIEIDLSMDVDDELQTSLVTGELCSLHQLG